MSLPGALGEELANLLEEDREDPRSQSQHLGCRRRRKLGEGIAGKQDVWKKRLLVSRRASCLPGGNWELLSERRTEMPVPR